MNLFGTMNVRENNLFVGEINTLELVKKFGTPLYVMDEEQIRDNCRRYMKAMETKGRNNKVAYAGKAFLTKAIVQIMKSEGLCLDVVSGGEVYTAIVSEFPMDKVYFHGNNKTIEEIKLGIKAGVGTFIVDNMMELENINNICEVYGKTQDILLRIIPGIEAHTHEYIKTGQIDSKFGFTLLEDNIFRVVKTISELENINLKGLHCHIGSQIFDIEPYKEAVRVMMNLMNSINSHFEINMTELNLGGGFGIYYGEGDDPKTIEEYCSGILNEVEICSRKLQMKTPDIIIEPGRSIVGNSGITLYTIGGVKEIPNIKKYVSVDGGMTDNIRPSLYSAQYQGLIANNVENNEETLVTISGKCCESGDVLINDISLPMVKKGDILAVLSTGAYCYSMSSNYNKIPKAPVVLVGKLGPRLICKRETYEDMLRNELDLYII
ncbi:diaminopimelate decarboxylase [Clostridium sp.]|uniref:diaminopimelate decarboxylase n=1 Tax=Clostridium sp. TaxID=1506 RepID=UPI0032180FC8